MTHLFFDNEGTLPPHGDTMPTSTLRWPLSRLTNASTRTHTTTVEDIPMRAFVCLTTQSNERALAAIGICAPDRATALANATSKVAEQHGTAQRVLGVLTQEEVTGMGMLLAAGRAGLLAKTEVEA